MIYADDGDKTYYHFNAHGDVVALTNANGSKTKSYSYNAFGVEYNEATLDDNPFRYCGEYYDKETQTIYLRARYYNAEQGRFTQQDGWEYANPQDPLSLNLYTYCWNKPVMCIDPSGHFAITATTIAVITLSAIISGVDMGISAKMCGQNFWKGFAAGAIFGGFCGALSLIPGLHAIFSVLFRALGTAGSSLLNELFQNGDLENMNWGTFFADIMLDSAYSMLYIDAFAKIETKALATVLSGTTDSMIDIIETELFYTPEAQDRIRNVDHSENQNNIDFSKESTYSSKHSEKFFLANYMK